MRAGAGRKGACRTGAGSAGTARPRNKSGAGSAPTKSTVPHMNYRRTAVSPPQGEGGTPPLPAPVSQRAGVYREALIRCRFGTWWNRSLWGRIPSARPACGDVLQGWADNIRPYVRVN